MSDGLDGFMRVVFVIEFFGVLLVRPLFAGLLQIGEPEGRRWKEALLTSKWVDVMVDAAGACRHLALGA